MSVCYYLACHHCRKFIWIAQDGLSGFTFYSGEPHTLRGLRDFLAAHALLPGHQLEFMSEHKLEGDEYMEYAEIDCPTQETVPAPEESILKAFERSPRRVQGTPADECTAKVRQHFDERRATTLSLSCECPAPPGQDCPLSVAECNERIAKRKGEPAQNREVE